MGMFDSLTCLYPLPLEGKLKELNVNWQEEIFQTKDLENFLEMYKITAEGRLLEMVVEQEYVAYTEAEKKALNHRSWSPYKEVIVKSSSERDTNYHGTVRFYTSLEYNDSEDVWVEFNAFFTMGQLERIEAIEPHLSKSAKLNELEWQAKYAAEAKKPWNRFKRFVGPFGWRWSFRKLSDFCCFLSQKLSTIQLAILKHML